VSTQAATIIREYRGLGILDLDNGTDSRCRFLARQYSDATVVLDCEHETGFVNIGIGSGPRAIKLRGSTDAQRPLVIDGPFVTTSIEHGTDGARAGTPADRWNSGWLMSGPLTPRSPRAHESVLLA
jgi:hypothetical protein